MKVSARSALVLAAAVALLVSANAATPGAANASSRSSRGDRAYYVLPPGNFGGLPTTAQSLDQLPLYDALTPLRGNVSDADIERVDVLRAIHLEPPSVGGRRGCRR